MKAERTHAPVRQSAIFAAYYAVLVVFLAASFFPEHRLWGVNWWAYFPGYVPFILFAIGSVAPIVMRLVLRRGELDIDDNQVSADRSSKYFIIVFSLTVLYGLAFYLLRARTHFLGDGYQILSLLTSDNPFIKPTERGEALVHLWVKSLVGDTGGASALLSYQIVSISAGVLFLIAVAWVSKRLFDRTIDRVLFWLGLASSGYMLLFFGYVENYSLFVLSVAVYSLMGLLVVRGKINRWLILPVVVLPIFFHVLGVTLIPSAIYLLVAKSKLGNTLARLNRKTKLLLGVIAAVILASLFYYFYSTNYFFRFAFVPLFENRFTVEGYTLLSFKHLLDYFNLLVLLLPSLPIVVATLLFSPMQKVFRQREYRYLMVLMLSTLGAIFILDPKLGMPRDWDLFSFCGIPLVVLSYYILLDYYKDKKQYLAILTLAILVGFLSLIPRVISQTSTQVSLAHFKDYLCLDKRKNRSARLLLINHYERLGDEAAAQLEIEKTMRDFPEKQHINRARAFFKQRRFVEAINWCEKAIKTDPVCFDAYVIAGVCFLESDKNDIAQTLLEIADGLNPYNPIVLNNLGTTYLRKGEFRRAEKVLIQSVKYDPGFDKPLYSLANLYVYRGDIDKSFTYFEKLESIEGVPADYFRTLGDNYLEKGYFDKAARAYQCALQKGLDSMYVKKLVEKYPQLRQ